MASDFKELIKAQQETTKAMMSAEDAARYDAILAERTAAFQAKSEAAKRGIEEKKSKAENDLENKKQAATEASDAKKAAFDKKLLDIQKKPALLRTTEEQKIFLEENNRKIEEKAKEDGVNFKKTKKWQDSQRKIDLNNLQLERESAGNDISAAAETEIRDKELKLQEDSGGMLGMIASGIIGLRKDFNIADKIKSAGKGIMTMLKTTVIAAFALALVAFLNSKYWVDTKNYIMDTIIPTLKRFYNAFFGPEGGFINGISELFSDESGIGSIVLGIGAVVTALVAFKIVSIVGTIISSITAIKGAFITMKAQYALMQTSMLAKLAALKTALVPLLPIIAIAAGIALLIGSLKAAFDEFEETLRVTGSVTEALKAGAAKFIGFLVGYPTKLVADLIGWVLKKLGFENVAKKLENFVGVDPIKSITDGVSDLMTTVGKFFDDIFDFDFMSFVKGIPGAAPVMDFLGIGGGDKKKGKGMEKAAAQLKYGDAEYGRGKVESKGFLSTIGSMFGSDDEEKLAPVNAVPRQKTRLRSARAIAGSEKLERQLREKEEFLAKMRESKLNKSTGGGAPVVISSPSTNVVNSNSNSSVSHISTPLTNNNPSVKAINYSF
jgi:hypothetical protein|tara:strand:- start:51 stop:1877 length:1827 start_codon:yes stop_codon:yes gene_type:complete